MIDDVLRTISPMGFKIRTDYFPCIAQISMNSPNFNEFHKIDPLTKQVHDGFRLIKIPEGLYLLCPLALVVKLVDTLS